MKKIILLMSVIACAMFVHAASVSWSSGTYSLVDKDGTTKLTSYPEGCAIVLALIGSDTEKFSDATLLQEGPLSSASKTAGRVTATYKFTYDNSVGAVNTIENGNILAVLFKDKDGNLKKLLTADGNADMYETYTVSGLGDNSWAGSAYAFATGNFQVPATTPIPEPTSGLLLLVGASLLALRRKQK